MANPVWSAQQKEIFNWFRGEDAKRKRNLVVAALAGTGKTTTIVQGITYAPESRILVAAFNKRIADEIGKKLTNANAEAKTLHSVGLSCVRRWWERAQIAEKPWARSQALSDAVCGGRVPDAIKRLVGTLMTKGREIAPHAKAAGELIELAEAFECVPDREWTAAGFDVNFVEAKALEAMELAASGGNPASGIDYADMLFLPVRNGWMTEQYDLVVVDEAQDMTITQLEIARGVCAKDGRIAVVGDRNQAIYAFRGADSDSLDRLKGELDAEELGLTKTYRCKRVIVREANRLVPALEAASAEEGQMRSMPTIAGVLAEVKANDFILSRVNAPLGGIAMSLLRAGVRVKIQGKDIGAGLVSLVRKLAKKRAKVIGSEMVKFLANLAEWETKEVERVHAKDRDDLAEAIRDKAATLTALTDGIETTAQLINRLEALFADDPEVGAVILSSVHKAKGLEASRVYILRPTLYPSPRPRPGKPAIPAVELAKRAREERNIEYVAITRAMDTLVWVEAR